MGLDFLALLWGALNNNAFWHVAGPVAGVALGIVVVYGVLLWLRWDLPVVLRKAARQQKKLQNISNREKAKQAARLAKAGKRETAKKNDIGR